MTRPAPLRIGVLLCDTVSERFGPLVGGSYTALFTDFLTAGAEQNALDVDLAFFAAVDGHLPAGPDVCDAWVVTGSRHDAFADEPWIVALREFLRDVVEHRGRVAGICFGHQVVATAFGGRVERTDQWMVGPQQLSLAATPWFDAAEVHLHAMHRDAVTVVPPGAEVIGRGSTAEVPAFLLGDNVLCVQDHPEFQADFVSALVQARAELIGEERSQTALDKIESQPTDGPALGAALLAFLADRRRAS